MKFGKALGVLTAAVAVPLVMTGTAYADIPFGQNRNGDASFYTDRGTGSCGSPIDASSQMLVAVSRSYWTSSNPNNDPLCGASVEVKYKGKTIKVPVRDQCPSCGPNKIDLSRPAFGQLADTQRCQISP
ncbi:cysteine/serine endopeptidase inhibitor [Kibdelosporangium lantanae]|uniref:Cysteine/serine endopeptidase inhibitor n=1 Tax=Kibdelosporangium lantanae TaxID=1497396 RepID=A0ABW3MHE9_9PSEU